MDTLDYAVKALSNKLEATGASEELITELAELVRSARGAGWDEACDALDWAFRNGPMSSGLTYVGCNNPYKKSSSKS